MSNELCKHWHSGMHDDASTPCGYCKLDKEIQSLQQQIQAKDIYTAQVELELKKRGEALQRLRDCEWVITLPDRMDGVRKIAGDALSDQDYSKVLEAYVATATLKEKNKTKLFTSAIYRAALDAGVCKGEFKLTEPMAMVLLKGLKDQAVKVNVHA